MLRSANIFNDDNGEHTEIEDVLIKSMSPQISIHFG